MKAPTLVVVLLAMVLAALTAPSTTVGSPVEAGWADAVEEDVAPAGSYVAYDSVPPMSSASVRTDEVPSPGPEVPSPGPEVSPSPEV